MMEMCSKIPILAPMNDTTEHIHYQGQSLTYVKLGAFTKLESISDIFRKLMTNLPMREMRLRAFFISSLGNVNCDGIDDSRVYEHLNARQFQLWRYWMNFPFGETSCTRIKGDVLDTSHFSNLKLEGFDEDLPSRLQSP